MSAVIPSWTAMWLIGCQPPVPPEPAPEPLEWTARQGVAKRITADDACVRGDVEACWWLGLERRWGDPEDRSGAWAAWSRGCDHGHGPSCEAAAVAAMTGDGGRRDPELVLARYRAGCEAGHRSSCLGEARLKPMSKHAVACAAALAGEEVSPWSCARSCDAFGESDHCARAATDLAPLCERRDAEACTWLAALPQSEDEKNAALWRACDLDDPWACLQLADRVARNQGSNTTPKSLEWLFNQVCDIQLDYGCVEHATPWETP